MSTKAAKKDIAAAEFLHADCDPRADETPVAAKNRYRVALKPSGLPEPTLIVDLGNGLHVLWRLSDPIPFPAATDLAWKVAVDNV